MKKAAKIFLIIAAICILAVIAFICLTEQNAKISSVNPYEAQIHAALSVKAVEKIHGEPTYADKKANPVTGNRIVSYDEITLLNGEKASADYEFHKNRLIKIVYMFKDGFNEDNKVGLDNMLQPLFSPDKSTGEYTYSENIFSETITVGQDDTVIIEYLY